jgi:hypothetical protein
MQTMQRRIMIGSIPLGWPERILADVFAVLLVMLGLAFGALVLGLGLAAGLGLMARIWWLRRRLRREGKLQHPAALIEGEYEVLERHSTTRSGNDPG